MGDWHWQILFGFKVIFKSVKRKLIFLPLFSTGFRSIFVSARLILPKVIATTRKWRQIWKWFLTHIKVIRVEIEIVAAQPFFVVFETASKVLIAFIRPIRLKSCGCQIYRYWASMKDLRKQREFIAAIFDWSPSEKRMCHCLCQIDIGKNLGWLTYQTMTWSWRQIRIWF